MLLHQHCSFIFSYDNVTGMRRVDLITSELHEEISLLRASVILFDCVQYIISFSKTLLVEFLLSSVEVAAMLLEIIDRQSYYCFVLV